MESKRVSESASQRVNEGSSPRDEAGRVEVYEKLRKVLTWEQLDFLANHLLEMQRAARQEHAEQQVIIVLNDKGYPRHLNRWVGMHFPIP
jgi:hypothetical protein